MKYKLLLLLVAFQLNSYAQTYVKFDENGLMNNSNAFGALLCPVSKDVATQIFATMKNFKIETKHINGYCEARADFLAKKMSLLYKKPGCEVGKIWAFAPSITTFISNTKLTTDNTLFPGEKISWDYHVAPIISIEYDTRTGKKVDTVVIDLSLDNNNFIEYHQWLIKLNCKEAIYTFTDRNYYLFYTLNGLKLTGSKYQGIVMPENLPKIITGHFYYPLLDDMLTVPSGLAYNELAVRLVEKYYNDPIFSANKEAIKASTKLNEMKSIIAGKVTDLPREIIDDCILYYYERLKYWQALFTS
jgi:hypothetical protein